MLTQALPLPFMPPHAPTEVRFNLDYSPQQ